MKKKLTILISFVVVIAFNSCNEDEGISEALGAKITAKSQIASVLTLAQTDFSSDSKLAAIFGWNVSSDGTIDLLKPTENIFVYVVQSDLKSENEFYIPVYGAGPIKSPINFTTMLSYIQDSGSKDKMGDVFGTLSTLTIASTASYFDSPDAINALLANTEAVNFRNSNPNCKVDMYLVPSKAVAVDGLTDSADWIITLKGESSSITLWRSSQTGIIIKF